MKLSMHINYYPMYIRTYTVKSMIKEKRGIRRDRLSFYLDEFMWWERYGQTRVDAFQKMLQQIAVKHPLP